MAEPVGLVIGGLGLVGIFNSCVTAFEYVDSGKKYGKAYQQSALQLSILGMRLSRWKESVDIREDLAGISDKVQVANPQETKQVQDLLGYIQDDIETAEKRSKRYELPPHDGTGTETIDALVARTRKLTLKRQKDSSLGKKVRWALHDKRAFEELIGHLNSNVTSLVTLFPAITAKQAELAVTDVAEVVQPAGIEEPDEAVSELRQASSNVDPELAAAVDRLAAVKGGYDFQNITMDDIAKAHFGTYVAPGWTGGDYGHSMLVKNVNLRGNTRVQFGHNLGGKNVLDDDNSMPFHAQVHRYSAAGVQRPGQQMQGYGGGAYGGGGWQRRN